MGLRLKKRTLLKLHRKVKASNQKQKIKKRNLRQ